MLEILIKKHRLSGVLLDTNLLLLYLIGSFDLTLIKSFKRTAMYTEQEFQWLDEFTRKFSKIVVTPQILAETWNFLEKLGEKTLHEIVKKLLSKLFILEEKYTHKDELLNLTGFRYLGITDASVICAAKQLNCLVLTDDLRAYSFFCSESVSAININHLRTL